jgi:hypothetical protein
MGGGAERIAGGVQIVNWVQKTQLQRQVNQKRIRSTKTRSYVAHHPLNQGATHLKPSDPVT